MKNTHLEKVIKESFSDKFPNFNKFSAPFFKAFAHVTFKVAKLSKDEAEEIYHSGTENLRGLLYSNFTKLKANPDKALPTFERELEAFIFKRFSKDNKILKAYYDFINNLLQKENANMSKKLTSSSMTKANLASFHKTTAAPQMPDWLKNMSDERREAYFEKNPQSKYNPNRKESKNEEKDDKEGKAKQGNPLAKNDEKKQEQIMSAMRENSEEVQKQLEPGSETRKKAAASFKEVKNQLKEHKEKDPKAYNKAVGIAKAGLKSDKPSTKYKVGSALGNYFGGQSAAGAGLAIAVAAGGATAATVAFPVAAVVSVAFAVKGVRRLAGYGGKYKDYNEKVGRKALDELNSSDEDMDDDKLMSNMIDGIADFMENGEITPEMVAEYGEIKKKEEDGGGEEEGNKEAVEANMKSFIYEENADFLIVPMYLVYIGAGLLAANIVIEIAETVMDVSKKHGMRDEEYKAFLKIFNKQKNIDEINNIINKHCKKAVNSGISQKDLLTSLEKDIAKVINNTAKYHKLEYSKETINRFVGYYMEALKSVANKKVKQFKKESKKLATASTQPTKKPFSNQALAKANFASFNSKPVTRKKSAKVVHKEEAGFMEFLQKYLHRRQIKQAKASYHKHVKDAYENIKKEIDGVKTLTDWLMEEAKKEGIELDYSKMALIVRNFEDDLKEIADTQKEFVKQVNMAFKNAG